MEYSFLAARLNDEDTGSLIDTALGEVEKVVASLIGAELGHDYGEGVAIVQLLDEKDTADGYAGLDANGLTACDIGLNPSVANGTAQGIKEGGLPVKPSRSATSCTSRRQTVDGGWRRPTLRQPPSRASPCALRQVGPGTRLASSTSGTSPRQAGRGRSARHSSCLQPPAARSPILHLLVRESSFGSLGTPRPRPASTSNLTTAGWSLEANGKYNESAGNDSRCGVDCPG